MNINAIQFFTLSQIILLYNNNDSADILAKGVSAAIIALIIGVISLFSKSKKDEKDEITSSNQENETDKIELMHSQEKLPEPIAYIAPEIKSSSKSIKSSGIFKKVEVNEVEFEDGLKGQILHDISGDSYYFKGKLNTNYNETFHYDDYLNCANALHYYLTENKLLKVHFVGFI